MALNPLLTAAFGYPQRSAPPLVFYANSKANTFRVLPGLPFGWFSLPSAFQIVRSLYWLGQ